MKIRKEYNKLKFDETIVYQCKNKKIFEKIINEMSKVFEKWDFMFIKDELNYKKSYFLLGMWRDGMFEIMPYDYKSDNDLYILADYKESSIEEQKHLQQIDDLIKIMDKYSQYLVKKRMILNSDFCLVKVGD